MCHGGLNCGEYFQIESNHDLYDMKDRICRKNSLEMKTSRVQERDCQPEVCFQVDSQNVDKLEQE